MTTAKYIKISSINDANDMFEAICQDILKKDVIEAKRQILGMNGKDRILQAHKVTINQLLAVISRFDMPFDLKVSYMEKGVEEEVVTEPLDEGGLKRDHVATSMERQKEEITNPDLLSAVAEQKKNEDRPIDTGSLPAPPDFF